MKTTAELRCLLISPSDVEAERAAVLEVVGNWNAQVGRALGARVELVRWESHGTPDLSAPPQEILNRQLLPDADFGLAIFWSRVGTPTAEYLSGSDEEIRRLLATGLRVLVYFSNRPIPQEALKTDQFSRLRSLRQELESIGLVGSYTELPDLREQVQLHLTGVVATLLAGRPSLGTSPGTEQVLTATRPDVRVSTSPAFVSTPTAPPISVLSIKVENHSPIDVFLASILIELTDSRDLFFKWDYVTDQPNTQRRLHAGDSFDFHLTAENLRSGDTNPALMRRVMVRDKIGRVYYSDENAFRGDVAAVLRGEELASSTT